jgi:mannose-1-phosphate guanylyltransferase / mannose-6-phosphate isomerase
MTGLIIPLVVCGGAGTRLQPISRESLPKQFLPLFGDYSTFQETILRISDPGHFAPPVVITHRSYREHVESQLAALAVQAEILLEPERRGSGPAILAGALHITARHGNDAMLLALAADHVIKDSAGFRRTCRAALDAATSGAIVTFGVVPDHPAIGYGYIEPGEALSSAARGVHRFIEKPDAQRAALYLRDGLLWNSGNFLFRAASLIDEYRRCDAETVEAVGAAVGNAIRHSNFVEIQNESFARAANRSIDYAVMEETTRAAVVPASHDWADIGSWEAVSALLRQGHDGGPRGLRTFAVEPDKRLELPCQLEQAEYWIIASGSGVATIAGTQHSLKANEFVHIPPDADGLIENRSESEMWIVAASAKILAP